MPTAMLSGRTTDFREHLLRLSLGLLAPLLLLVATGIYAVSTGEVARIEQEAAKDAAYLADTLDDEIKRAADLVTTLAAMLTEQPDLAVIHAAAQRSIVPSGVNLVIHDETGRQVLNAGVPWSTSLDARSSHPEHLEMAATASSVVVSDLLVGSVRRKPVILVTVPWQAGDKLWLMSASLTYSHIAAVADASLRRPEQWRWGITDAKGRFIARSHDIERFVGTELPTALRLSSVGPSGINWETSVDGTAILRAYRRTKHDWLVAVAVPRSEASAPLRRAWLAFAGGSAVLLGLAVGVALRQSRLLAMQVARLKSAAAALGSGRPITQQAVPIAEFQSVYDVMVVASAEQRAAEETKTLLLRELQHRTKNLLAIASATVNQTLIGTDLANARTTLNGRLTALATATDLLSDAGWRGSSMRLLIDKAMEPFGSAYRCRGPEVFLNPSWGTNLALVIHELATNATKHGALAVPRGRVNIVWSLKEERLTLRWRETGGPIVTPPSKRGFGLRLLHAIGRDADHEPRIAFRPTGFTYELTVPIAEAIQTKS
jgi:two-component sensor histidine kinase